MTDFKIRPPVGPAQRPVQATERSGGTSRPFDVGAHEATTSAAGASEVSEPSALVEEIRAGRLDVGQAVEILVDQALREPMIAAAPEALRHELRRALVDLVSKDPTLADLASAMKR